MAWKEEVASKWDGIRIISNNFDEAYAGALRSGDKLNLKVVLDTNGLGESIGVELVSYREKHGESTYEGRQELKVVNVEGSNVTYELDAELTKAGTYRYALRMFPKNAELPHRQDFAYVRWF